MILLLRYSGLRISDALALKRDRIQGERIFLYQQETGTSAVLRVKGARAVETLHPWESRRIGAAVITAVPAVHMARAVGYVVQLDGASTYFAGDTYYRPFMADIGRRFDIDVALLPVTTFRIPPTMGEVGACAAVRDLHPATVIPIHLGIRPRLSFLRGAESLKGFRDRLRTDGSAAHVVHLREGEQWDSAGSLASSRAARQDGRMVAARRV